MEVIVNGWPDETKDLPKCVKSYVLCRNSLSVDNGLVLKGDSIIIPSVLQADTLRRIHDGHQGVTKCQLRAKNCVYWPGINKEIERVVGSCSICQEHLNAQAPQPLTPHEIPQRAWQNVATDLFHLDGAEHLIVADYYSKAFFVRKVEGPCTSAKIVQLTKEIFSENGVPCKVISDNGPQYSSAEYKKFAEQWRFDHVTSSPTYARSNGFIERTIQTVKKALKKATSANFDPQLALLCLRTTPIDNTLPSPGELLNGRRMRDTLPLKVKSADVDTKVPERLQERQDTQKRYHDDRGVKDLSTLLPGQSVLVRNHQSGRWLPATVSGKCDEPRSYMVTTPNGNTLRRNRCHLRDVEPQLPARKQVRFAPEPQQDHRRQDVSHSRQDVAIPDTPPPKSQVKIPDSGSHVDAYKTRSGRSVRKPERLLEN